MPRSRRAQPHCQTDAGQQPRDDSAPTSASATTGDDSPAGDNVTETDASPSFDGPPAPDFELALSDGSTFALSAEQKPVYIVFWARKASARSSTCWQVCSAVGRPGFSPVGPLCISLFLRLDDVGLVHCYAQDHPISMTVRLALRTSYSRVPLKPSAMSLSVWVPLARLVT